tara:strand:- start:77 stop:280 length:204 start_codon:yes stop_codon:yes gene_type:complete
MKITKNELKQIIKEELDQSLNEEQLNENAVALIMSALKNPAVQNALATIVLPMIQQVLANANNQASE